jgi:rhodanese-related sulfurtransferase
MKKLIYAAVTVMVLNTLAAAAHPDTEKIVNEAIKEAGEMAPKELKKLIDDGADVIVLDIREFEQRAEGEIYADETHAVTRGNLEFEIPNKIKNKEARIVTYCRGGSRGALAAQTLKKMGYKNAINLQGGLKGWAKAGYPVDSGLGVMRLSPGE